MRSGFKFGAEEYFRIKRLCLRKVVCAEDETEIAAASGDQTARGSLGMVMQFFDGIENFKLRLPADTPLAVEDQGDGGNRNAGSTGNITNCCCHRNVLL